MMIRMGGFHVAMNYLTVLGKKCNMSGIENLLTESGMCGSSTNSTLLKGKFYTRGVSAHKIARFRLQWLAFMQWLHKKECGDVDYNAVIQQDIACQLALDEGKDAQNTTLRIYDDTTTLDSEFTRPSRLPTGVNMCPWYNCFSSSSKQ